MARLRFLVCMISCSRADGYKQHCHDSNDSNCPQECDCRCLQSAVSQIVQLP
eukprot:IDg19382t1